MRKKTRKKTRKKDMKKDAKKRCAKKDAKKVREKKTRKKTRKKDGEKRREKKRQLQPSEQTHSNCCTLWFDSSCVILSYFEFYKAFITAFFLRTVRNHYIIKNIELIILSNQWTPLVDNFCQLVFFKIMVSKLPIFMWCPSSSILYLIMI